LLPLVGCAKLKGKFGAVVRLKTNNHSDAIPVAVKRFNTLIIFFIIEDTVEAGSFFKPLFLPGNAIICQQKWEGVEPEVKPEDLPSSYFIIRSFRVKSTECKRRKVFIFLSFFIYTGSSLNKIFLPHEKKIFNDGCCN
jgi:hypothetical protein